MDGSIGQLAAHALLGVDVLDGLADHHHVTAAHAGVSVNLPE